VGKSKVQLTRVRKVGGRIRLRKSKGYQNLGLGQIGEIIIRHFQRWLVTESHYSARVNQSTRTQRSDSQFERLNYFNMFVC
jgi:hypothetical protein